MLPLFLHKYFWDTDVTKVSIKKNASYIIERILEYGDEGAIRWLNNSLDKSDILRTLEHSRVLSPRSAFFWAAVFGVSEKKILCLRTPSRQRRLQHSIW